MWRLFAFDLFETQPPVMVLPVHLPNMQTLQMNPEENLEAVVENSKRARTPLTEFFAENSKKGAEQLTYGNFTKKFRWDKGEKRWFKRRTKLLVIGRIVFVAPSEEEQYFLRILLLHVQGPKSFEDLCTDFQHKFPNESNKVIHLTASSVEISLEAMGKSLKSFNLEHLLESENEELRRTKDIIDALDAPIPQNCIDCRSMLNAEQKAAFDAIVSHIKEEKPGAFFIDGPGSTGKTFLYNALYAEVRLMGKIVLPTATSGIAAANLPSGRTTHSRFKLPPDTDASLTCDVPKQGSLAALIKATSLIIWDEASMAKKANLDALDLLLRDMCNSDLIFGGKIIVFGGDFRQVLPVIPYKSQREAVKASIGIGDLQTEENQFVQLPPEIVRHSSEAGPDPITEITTVTFPEIDVTKFNSDIFTTRAILTLINDDVDAINSVLINKSQERL
ncbi:uncharacterized protein LOC141614428 [Silene latifolia]|uniref:uncharacterized protein LOC141614428 n=1 Tax=Silene latifolia TaxID=37657 RepID=UPI003D78A63F